MLCSDLLYLYRLLTRLILTPINTLIRRWTKETINHQTVADITLYILIVYLFLQFYYFIRIQPFLTQFLSYYVIIMNIFFVFFFFTFFSSLSHFLFLLVIFWDFFRSSTSYLQLLRCADNFWTRARTPLQWHGSMVINLNVYTHKSHWCSFGGLLRRGEMEIKRFPGKKNKRSGTNSWVLVMTTRSNYAHGAVLF